MKLFAPKYYRNFTCIADKCRHSCCIGWEIDIDSETRKKYDNLKCKYSEKILESIDESDEPHFRLGEGERCPHLNGSGLCEIIINVGEEYLCDICREHPRFYNDTACGREVGLGMACEEACRIILSSDEYSEMVELDEDDGEEIEGEFDAVSLREEIYGILLKPLPYCKRLEILYSRFGVEPGLIDCEHARVLINSLEYMDESHKAMFLNYSSDLIEFEKSDKMLERALAYFVYRHCSGAEDYEDFRSSLGFCFFCERLLSSIVRNADEQRFWELARILSEEIEYSEDNTDLIKSSFPIN